MGKKNKNSASGEKKPQEGSRPQTGSSDPSQGRQQSNVEQSTSGGSQSQRGLNKQQSRQGEGDEKRGQNQKNQQPRSEKGERGFEQTQKRIGDGPRQEGGRHQQQGAWGGVQSQRQSNIPQGKDQSQSGPKQQSGGGQNQGAWGQHQQARTQQSEQQRGSYQQRVDSRQEQHGAIQQRSEWSSQQQRRQGGDGPRQEGGRHQQQGAWGGVQSQRQGNIPQGKDQSQSGPKQQGGGGQNQGHWGQHQQARTQQSEQQRGSYQQRVDSRQEQHGAMQQRSEWGSQQGGGRQQGGRGDTKVDASRSQGSLNKKFEEFSISDEAALPVMEKSCNGIVRGTLGKPGVVEVNYVKLDLSKMPNEAYHYDVTITPDRPKKFLRPAFEQLRLKLFPNVFAGFDGMKNCYTFQRLKTPIDDKVEVHDTNNRMKEFQVKIQETDCCVVDLNSLRTYKTERVFDKPMRALQVLEVVLACNNHERGLRVGRSFFRRPRDACTLEDGYEAWTGLYQAAILGEQPLLNVDIAHKSFPCESTLLDYLQNQKIDIRQDITASRYKDVINYLKGINIIYTPPKSFGATPKNYKVLDIGEPASKKKFKTEDGKELTVASYYQSRGYTLMYPNLNCITTGSSVRQISLPMEFCSIPSGQALNRKDKDRQVQHMIRYAATSTNRRKEKIMELLRFFEHNQNPTIQAFGLRIGSNFIKVPMRLLPQPYLEYLQGKTVTTFKGAWRMEGDLKFLITSKPPNGHKWAILYEESGNNRGISYHDLQSFKTNVIKTSKSLNMNLQDSAEIMTYSYRELQVMLKKLATNSYDLVFVVLSDRGTPYSKIKQTAELEVGILTQCIKDKTIFRTNKDRTVFSNILLKVNGKLNGTNHKIAQERGSNLLSPIKNVMYLGADVTHPSPDQSHIPSVVGVAASHDANGACYNCQYRLQRAAVENIEDMESIVRHHLGVYHKYQKNYPSQIIYYRDGVSDGQFPIVEREEIRAIRNACKKLGCNAKLTCVIVVKRHHTRFFPLTQPQHDRDFNNVQAGTVVDQHITHPNEVQFFMVSHQSIQGTARPTRYNVIMDESKFDINLLQKLTYNLCHLFPRCNRSVSYPAPAYLAHLVAFRGRVYLEGTQRFDNLKREYERRQIKPEFMIRNPMYFI